MGGFLSRIWTDYLWYEEVGYTTVFWTPIVARLCVGLFFAVVFFAVFYGSLWLARKISPRLLAVPETPKRATSSSWASSRRWPGRLLLVVSIVVAIIIGIIYSSRWEQVLLFLNRVDFGYADPLFDKDASFFVFTLPVWKMLVNFVGIDPAVHLHRHRFHLRGRPGPGAQRAATGSAWLRTSRPTSR